MSVNEFLALVWFTVGVVSIITGGKDSELFYYTCIICSTIWITKGL